MKTSVLTLLLLLAANLFAQSNDLQKNITDISAQLREIRTVKATISQRLTVKSGSIVSFDLTTTDPKGNRSSESYLMDLADIDPNGLESGIERNMMKVEIHTLNNERLVAQMSQGEIKRYVPTFKLDVEDNDHARALMDALKQAAIDAKHIEEGKYRYASLDEILMDLSLTIRPFSTVTEQKTKSDPQRKDKLNIHIQENNGVTKRYEFNLKDMNATTIKVEAHGTTLSVPVDAYGGEKVVKLYENDLAKGFVSRVEVFAESVDDAKRIRKLLELAIDAAKGKLPEASGKAAPVSSAATTTAHAASSSTSSQSSDQQEYPNVELTKDPVSGKYAWAGIYQVSGHSAKALYTVMNSIIPSKRVIARIENEQIVFQLMGGNGTALRLAGDAYLSLTIKVGFKDGKVRMQVTDIFYDNRAWGFSAPQTLEAMDGKKLNKIVGDINERLTNAFRADIDALKKKIRLTENEDW